MSVLADNDHVDEIRGDVHGVLGFRVDSLDNAFKGLFGELGDRYKDRAGGYTRILKLSSNRHGDNAEMAIITLVEDEIVKRKKKKPAKKKSANVNTKNPAEEVTVEDVSDSNAAAAISAEPAEEVKVESTEDKPAPEAKSEESTPPAAPEAEDAAVEEPKAKDKGDDAK